MNREDVLSKSRYENKKGDERERLLKYQSYSISFAILAASLMIVSFLSYLNVIHGKIRMGEVTFSLYELTLFLLFEFGIIFGLSRFFLLKKKVSLIWILISFAGFLMLFLGIYGVGHAG